MKVHLRKRKQTKSGKISLYLEYYKGTVKTEDGKTKAIRDYEYLDLYLKDNPQTKQERQTNNETLELAKSIKSKRELEIKNGVSMALRGQAVVMLILWYCLRRRLKREKQKRVASVIGSYLKSI